MAKVPRMRHHAVLKVTLLSRKLRSVGCEGEEAGKITDVEETEEIAGLDETAGAALIY